jgi:hypothetical protein
VTDSQEGYKRSWLAIGLGTMVIVVSYSSILVAVVASRTDTPEAAGPAFALGFALVPIVFVTVAFVSGRKAAPIAALKGMGLWLVVALPLGLFNPVFGLCAAFGIGGVLTLKVGETDSWIIRTVAVGLVASYSLLMVFIIPALGVVSGGLLPLAALGIADYYSRNRGTKSH